VYCFGYLVNAIQTWDSPSIEGKPRSSECNGESRKLGEVGIPDGAVGWNAIYRATTYGNDVRKRKCAEREFSS